MGISRCANGNGGGYANRKSSASLSKRSYHLRPGLLDRAKVNQDQPVVLLSSDQIGRLDISMDNPLL